MSWQAQTAVTYHSEVRNVELLRLLHYLADHANEHGRIDPAPNQDTLSDFFEVSVRTIRTRLRKLEAAGELEQTRVGSGPGNPSAYAILLPMPEETTAKGGRKAEEESVIVSALTELKAEVKAEIDQLKAEVLALKAEKAEGKGGKGGRERRKVLQRSAADDPGIDPILDPTPPQSPPSEPEEDSADSYLVGVWEAMSRFYDDPRQKNRLAVAQVKFSEATCIKQPYVNGDRGRAEQVKRYWWDPLEEMISEADNNLDVFVEVMRHVARSADRYDWTLSYPAHALKKFKALIARKRRGVSLDPDSPYTEEKDWLDDIAVFEE